MLHLHIIFELIIFNVSKKESQNAMAVSTAITTLKTDAASVWKLLNGIVCVYKPPGMSLRKIDRDIRHKLCEDLNMLKPLPRQDIVQIRRIPSDHTEEYPNDPNEKIVAEISDGKGVIKVVQSLNYASHPLVLGNGYLPKDIKILHANNLGKESSGLSVIGVNKHGCKTASNIILKKWLKTYIVSGEFGKATDTFFHTGKVLEKAKYHSIKKHMIDRMLASSQLSHQRMAFAAAGVPLASERAYELASQGLVRPQEGSASILYSMKCLKFDPPNFDIELIGVNETDQYLMEFIHQLGLRLHSVAVCTKVRCIKVGPFGVDTALLGKHWSVENFISNINQNARKLQNVQLYERDPLIGEV